MGGRKSFGTGCKVWQAISRGNESCSSAGTSSRFRALVRLLSVAAMTAICWRYCARCERGVPRRPRLQHAVGASAIDPYPVVVLPCAPYWQRTFAQIASPYACHPEKTPCLHRRVPQRERKGRSFSMSFPFRCS